MISDEKTILKSDAPRSLYIVAWLLASFSSAIVSKVLFASLSIAFSDAIFGMLVITGIASGATLVVVYTLFKSLNKTKVIPWIWLAAMLNGIVSALIALPLFDTDTALAAAIVVEPFAIAFFFHWHFENDAERFGIIKTESKISLFDFKGNSSKVSDATSIDNDMKIVGQLYPDVMHAYKRLHLYSRDCQQKFASQILKTRSFSEYKILLQKISDEYINENFGTDLRITAIAERLYAERNEAGIAKLKDYVRIFGETITDEQLKKLKDELFYNNDAQSHKWMR